MERVIMNPNDDDDDTTASSDGSDEEYMKGVLTLSNNSEYSSNIHIQGH
jgi:hypothetical protein